MKTRVRTILPATYGGICNVDSTNQVEECNTHLCPTPIPTPSPTPPTSVPTVSPTPAPTQLPTPAPSLPTPPPGSSGTFTYIINNSTKGTKMLHVTNSFGFAIGDEIRLNPGNPTEEECRIDGFGSIIVKDPLIFAHGAGEIVLKVRTEAETSAASPAGPAASPARS